MSGHSVSLHDKYDLSQETVLLNGTQALVRLMLMQHARDKAAGLNTAGYVSGYRGSPLGAVDQHADRSSVGRTPAQYTGLQAVDHAVTVAVGKQEITRIECRGTASDTDRRGLLDKRNTLDLDAQILAID